MDLVRPSGWRTSQGRVEYLAAYDATMELWPVPFESRQVPTRFGSNHVVVSGASEAKPLVLLHAATGFGATQWYPNVARLATVRRCFAIDFIGSAGKGTQSRPILKRSDCAIWLADVLDGLHIARADVVGSSQGGWLALNLALLMPERIGALALLAPAGSIVPIRPLMRFFIRLGPHMPAWTGPPSIKALFGGRIEIDSKIIQLLSLHLKHFRYQRRAVFPTAFPKDELRKLAARTLLIVGEHEAIYKPAFVLERACRLIPNIETEFVEGAGHLVNMELPELVDDRVIRFLTAT